MAILLVLEPGSTLLDPAFKNCFDRAKVAQDAIDLLIVQRQQDPLPVPKVMVEMIRSVLVLRGEYPGEILPEDFAPFVAQTATAYDLVIAGQSRMMDQVMARCAAALKRNPLLGVTHFSEDNQFRSFAFSHSAEKIEYTDQKPVILTLEAGSIIQSEAEKTVDFAEHSFDKVKQIGSFVKSDLARLQAFNRFQGDGGALETAQIIIGCGAGVSEQHFFSEIEELADLLKGELAGSKMAIELGFLPASKLIGQSGKSVAPKVYLALGISGSMHHMAGVQDADVIIAVNKDGEAPIISMADYSLIGDIHEIIPKLVKLLKHECKIH